MFDIIRKHYIRHGAVSIETPIMEHKHILMGKYGEDGDKLIYELDDQGGAKLALRYDHTVPLARYCCQYGVKQMVRYVIGKVYRRDNPSLATGRFREFYQCDIDFVGDYQTLKPDAECLKILSDILTDLQIGRFVIKINHRELLDGIFEVCGVPVEKFRTVSSSVDKLDKTPWEEVYQELLNKGLTEETATKIGTYTVRNGPFAEFLNNLLTDTTLVTNTKALQGLRDLQSILSFMEIWPSALNHVVFDLSLARGLDYYTGLIFEAVALEQGEDSSIIGSVSGGGRYNGLMENFGGDKVPAVGFTVGVERLYALKIRQAGIENKPSYARGRTDIYVATMKVDEKEAMKLCQVLWDNGLSATFSYRQGQNLKKQLSDASEMSAQYAIILGQDEIKNNVLSVKNLATKEQKTLNLQEALEVFSSLKK
jgi:histidyl-tRNA synthetase